VQTVSGATNDLFTYDARGNVTGGGNGRFSGIKYTSFDLPDSTQGITGAPAQPHYTWQYGEDNARVTQTRRVLSSDGVHDDVRTTWYDNPDNAGGLSFEYEIDQPAAANTLMRNVAESRHFLTIGGQPIGVLISEGVLGSTAVTPPVISSIALTKVEYWNQDHLGSIVATTDHTAAVTARYSYDPFGKRRANSGAYDASGAVLADWSTVVDNGTARGFTGHEHLDDIGLIQMNGRIFEPTLGVFLQGDTSVPHPQDLQSFHRYAYCRNNPMGCSDPTGMVDSPPQTVDITGTSPGGSPGRGIFGGQIADPGHDHNGRGARTILVTPTGTNISYKVVIPAEKESTAGTAQTPIVLVVIPGTNQAVPVAELMNSLGVTNPQDLVAVLNAMADAKGKVSIVAAGGAATAAAESRFGSSVLSALGRVVGWGVESAEFATLVVLSPLLLSGDTDRTQAAALNSAAQATATQSDTKRDSLTWYHYTDQAGLSAIMASGGTLVANNGRVYGSPLPMSPQDANTTLFIGGPPGFEKKGQYVVAFKFNDPYMTMVPSAKPGEFFYPGSLRDGRQITITSAGPNPFGASK
jgi:RHS repeat-associated protein